MADGIQGPAETRNGRAVKLAVFGLFGSPNLGNEATLAAFLHGIRQRIPLARFVCIASRHSRAVQMHGIDGLIDMFPLPVAPWFWRLTHATLRNWIERAALSITSEARLKLAARSLVDCEALFVPGTGVIEDFGQGPDDLPAHFERWVKAARRVKIPVHVVSVGASRVDHPRSRARFVNALRDTATCSFRDEVSASNARELGFADALEVVPDLAFSLPVAGLPARSPDWPPRTVGLGVMGYRGWSVELRNADEIYRNYLERTADLVEELLSEGYEVRLLTGDTQADETVPADLNQMLQLRRAPVERLFLPSIGSYADVLREIGECDLVVAARYHNVLLALMTGRPVVSIGYSDKNNAVMADMGQSAWCHDIETFDARAVVADVRTLAAGPSSKPKLLERAAEFRERLEKQFDALAKRWQ
jgi:polysaccharide pyruvyl transferase WcaK-like protein